MQTRLLWEENYTNKRSDKLILKEAVPVNWDGFFFFVIFPERW